MKNILKFFVFSLILFPSLAFADTCYVGTGFGDPLYNDTFLDSGSQYTDPNGGFVTPANYFVGETNGYHLYQQTGGYWIANPTLTASNFSHDYYSVNGTNDASGSFTAQDGASPGGTMASSSCASVNEPIDWEDSNIAIVFLPQSIIIFLLIILIILKIFEFRNPWNK